MKRSVSLFLKTKAKALVKRLNGFGNSRQCYVCKRRFFRFTKFAGGSKAIPDFNRRLELVGSDVDNFGCLYCNSHDRERHLFMLFLTN